MRKILLSVLAASTALTFASPALAQRASSSDRDNAREVRSERAQARQDRAQRQQQGQRAQRAQRAQRTERAAPRAERAQPVQRAQRGQPAQRQVRPAQRQAQPAQRQAQPAQRQVRPTQRVIHAGPPAVQTNRVRDRGARVESERQVSRDRASRYSDRQRRAAPPQGARPDRMAPARSTATHTRTPRWSTDWRRDRRYDWRSHRERNRTHFRVGIYYDPFGWNYRRFNVGWRLWPAFYSSHFWLTNPQMYQLPYAPWPYRWVRYYNDVLLVDTMSGQVVDVIYDFFW